MNLTDIETPALVLDRERLDRNLKRMHQRISGLGARLRPHVKTAKCIDVVWRAAAPDVGGITVSTLKEADRFFAVGYRDILYAVGVAPHKLDHVVALRRQGCDLSLILDNLHAAHSVTQKSAIAGIALPVLIEIDSDGHRAGVRPGDAQLVEIGRVLQGNLRGVMTHAGGSYDCKSVEDIRHYSHRERFDAVCAAEQLRTAGLRCPVRPPARRCWNPAGLKMLQKESLARRAERAAWSDSTCVPDPHCPGVDEWRQAEEDAPKGVFQKNTNDKKM